MTDPALQRAPVFAHLTADQFGALCATMQKRRLPKGQILYHEGRAGDSLCVVASGALSVRAGEGTELARLGPSDVVGEMTCVDPAPRSATVVALEDTVVHELSRLMFDVLRTNAAPVASAVVGGVIDTLNRRLRSVHARVDALEGGAPPPPQLPLSRGTLQLASTQPPRPLETPLDLAALPGLDGLDITGRRLLVQVAAPMVWQPQAELCAEGDPGTSCFLLVEGEVEIVKNLSPQPKVVARLGAGALLGQLALVDHAPRSATIRASSRVVALEFDREEFVRLLADASPLALHFQERCAIAGIRQLWLADKWLAESESKARQPRERRPLARSQNRASLAELTAGMSRRDSSTSATRRRGSQPIRPTRRGKRPLSPSSPSSPSPEGPAPASIQERPKDYNGYLKAALSEWSISLDDLDNISFESPTGQISSAEIRARRGR
jgi:CRP-like cAMP-binding protein